MTDPTDAARVARAAEQLVEHVDGDGRVIAIVSRAEMRAQCLRHRSVYIAVTDRAGRLLVHRRAGWKDIYPGAWDLAFGGVCDVGEGWATAAERELFEEAGINATLHDCGPVAYEATEVSLVGRLYTCVHDGPFSFDDGEVTATTWVDLDDLDDFVAGHEVPDDSVAVVRADALRRGDTGEHANDR